MKYPEAKLVFPINHYPSTKTLAEIVVEEMGSSEDPDAHLLKNALPTSKQRQDRDANVAAEVEGKLN